MCFPLEPVFTRDKRRLPNLWMGLWLGWGVIGVAFGMSIDLVFRGAIFLWRLKSQKWTQFQLI